MHSVLVANVVFARCKFSGAAVAFNAEFYFQANRIVRPTGKTHGCFFNTRSHKASLSCFSCKRLIRRAGATIQNLSTRNRSDYNISPGGSVMTIFKTSLLVLSLVLTQSITLAGVAKSAPPEVAHFARLIGQWSTAEESLKPDGSGWIASKGADWDFEWAYDGFGVVDYYVSPPAAVKVEDETRRQRGINLRTFNPQEKHWVMTWLTAAAAPPSGFTATSTEDHIIMLSDQPGPGGFYRKITFFDMQDKSFEWKLERSKDQKQWREVYRIHGTRKGE